jgi:hypothetical protein
VAAAVRSLITFARTQAKIPNLDYQRLYLSGGGARLRGLGDYLAGKTKRRVNHLDLFAGLDLRKLDPESARCFQNEVPDMAIALGLAILDADPRLMHLQLLPPKEVRRQAFWNKKIWAFAAGVLFFSGLIYPYQMADHAWQTAKAKELDFSNRVSAAKQLKVRHAKRVEESAKLRKRREYYAAQTRLNLVYLNLFAQVRDWTPQGFTLTWFGPRKDDPSGKGAGLSDELFDSPMRKVQIAGFYDKNQVKDFNGQLNTFFNKLKEVPGAGMPTRDLSDDVKQGELPPGMEPFRFEIALADPWHVTGPDGKPLGPGSLPPRTGGR